MSDPIERPNHRWNDPDDDGHNCADCTSDSMWKCDRLAHIRGPYDVLSETDRASLDVALTEANRARRRGNASARQIELP